MRTQKLQLALHQATSIISSKFQLPLPFLYFWFPSIGFHLTMTREEKSLVQEKIYQLQGILLCIHFCRNYELLRKIYENQSCRAWNFLQLNCYPVFSKTPDICKISNWFVQIYSSYCVKKIYSENELKALKLSILSTKLHQNVISPFPLWTTLTVKISSRLVHLN